MFPLGKLDLRKVQAQLIQLLVYLILLRAAFTHYQEGLPMNISHAQFKPSNVRRLYKSL